MLCAEQGCWRVLGPVGDFACVPTAHPRGARGHLGGDCCAGGVWGEGRSAGLATSRRCRCGAGGASRDADKGAEAADGSERCCLARPKLPGCVLSVREGQGGRGGVCTACIASGLPGLRCLRGVSVSP